MRNWLRIMSNLVQAILNIWVLLTHSYSLINGHTLCCFGHNKSLIYRVSKTQEAWQYLCQASLGKAVKFTCAQLSDVP